MMRVLAFLAVWLLVPTAVWSEVALRQSTASQEVPLGTFVDKTDFNTEEAALTIANTDIKLWKAGATTLADKNSGGAT